MTSICHGQTPEDLGASLLLTESIQHLVIKSLDKLSSLWNQHKQKKCYVQILHLNYIKKLRMSERENVLFLKSFIITQFKLTDYSENNKKW